MVLLVTSICLLVVFLRVIAMRCIDGSMIYDRYIVQLSSTSIGMWIFFVTFWLSERMPNIFYKIGETTVLKWFANISYEVYIVHVWFLNGKWQVANYIQNIVIADIVVIVLSLIAAESLHLLSQRLITVFRLLPNARKD